jgi:hypothetical protein
MEFFDGNNHITLILDLKAILFVDCTKAMIFLLLVPKRNSLG